MLTGSGRSAAAVRRFSAKRASKSRLELSVGGGWRGGAMVVVVVVAAVGKVMGGRENTGDEELDLEPDDFLSSLINHAEQDKTRKRERKSRSYTQFGEK